MTNEFEKSTEICNYAIEKILKAFPDYDGEKAQLTLEHSFNNCDIDLTSKDQMDALLEGEFDIKAEAK